MNVDLLPYFEKLVIPSELFFSFNQSYNAYFNLVDYTPHTVYSLIFYSLFDSVVTLSELLANPMRTR